MCEINFDTFSGVPQGWQCPVCKRVYSPSTPCCYFCGNETTTVSTSSEFITGLNTGLNDSEKDEKVTYKAYVTSSCKPRMVRNHKYYNHR
jgi:hypothetical protein